MDGSVEVQGARGHFLFMQVATRDVHASGEAYLFMHMGEGTATRLVQRLIGPRSIWIFDFSSELCLMAF